MLIGRSDGSLPWRIPEESKFFKETTMGHPVICGHNTWKSIPEKFRPLPGRLNIILSRNEVEYPGAFVVPTIQKALELTSLLGCNHVFVIGGAQIYKLALEQNLVDQIVASKVKGDYTGDIYFPTIDENVWKEELLNKFDQFDSVIYTKK